MQNPINDIRQAFGAYAQAFNSLEPEKVEPFFHLPAMLMTSERVAVMLTNQDVIKVFEQLMDSLKKQDFKESKIIGSLKVIQLSNNQGQVAGIAKRFNRADEEIEHFGFTYTLRKVETQWKIIAGVLHEPETFSNS